MNNNNLERGFPKQEFFNRMQKIQKVMHEKKLDAILLSTQANIYYFTGFLTQFWKSPTRPWFVVLPAEGKPIAVIPSIGKSGMEQTWLDDIRTWDSPNTADDGVSLLTETLAKLCKKYNKIGTPLGLESFIQMPYNNFQQVRKSLSEVEIVDVALDIYKIRSIKSSLEIKKIQQACLIANTGFEMLEGHARIGQTEREISKQMEINMLQNGADSVEYLICGSGQNGYDSIIMGPLDKKITKGDIAIWDTGVMFDGYYSDFCRNFAFGEVSEQAKKANQTVYDSIDKAFAIARPGITTSDLFNAMWQVLEAGGALGNNVGRLGHGLGCELTEWPSNTAHDNTILEPGMVITLEPGMIYAKGKSLVHEENIIITEDGATWLSQRAASELTIIS